MPAQSPTLSPTLSAIVAALRGSSSGMFCSTLPDEIGAHVSRFGEDAAADPHEHREQRGPETEALQHRRGVAGEAEHDDRRTQQPEADRRHAD